jgi:hypothetical protein
MRMEYLECVARIGYWGKEKFLHGLVGESEGKRRLGRARRRWVGKIKGKIKVYLRGKKCDGVDWISVAQGGDKRRTAVNPIMNLGYRCTCFLFKKDSAPET